MRCNGNLFFHLWRTPTPESKHCDAAQTRAPALCLSRSPRILEALAQPADLGAPSQEKQRHRRIPQQYRVFVPQTWNEGQSGSHEARLASALIRRGELKKTSTIAASPATFTPSSSLDSDSPNNDNTQPQRHKSSITGSVQGQEFVQRSKFILPRSQHHSGLAPFSKQKASAGNSERRNVTTEKCLSYIGSYITSAKKKKNTHNRSSRDSNSSELL